MTIYTRTRNHYERTDKNKPLQPYGSVSLPVCLTCGGYVIPLTIQNARCPTCDATVSWVKVPEDRINEVREEMRK